MDDSSNNKLDLSGILVILFISIACLSLVRLGISHFWGIKEIGSFFEAPRPYTTQYYVYLFSERNSVKNYRLPADLNIDNDCENDGETSTCFDLVSLEKAYFPNGGYLYFNDCILDMKKDSSSSCIDQDGVSWNIQFKNEKVK
jgi:hypothetical protein